MQISDVLKRAARTLLSAKKDAKRAISKAHPHHDEYLRTMKHAIRLEEEGRDVEAKVAYDEAHEIHKRWIEATKAFQ